MYEVDHKSLDYHLMFTGFICRIINLLEMQTFGNRNSK